MPQISKGDTFADSQQLTATRLNQLVDSATLLVGAITDQTPITANTLEATDSIIVSDSGLLRKATIGDVLNSNLPVIATSVTTSSVNAEANKDIIVTPADGLIVTSKVFTSANGILVAVASTAHGLVSGQVVQVTASVPAYSGTYRITVIGVDEFTYTLPDAVTAASGTCSYIKKATEVVNGQLSVNQNSYIDGSSTIVGSSLVRGNSTINGTQEVKGQATFTLAPMVGTASIQPRFDYFVQTRAQSVLTGYWGGLQNLVNPYGTKISNLDITFTPKKAGNKVVLMWTLFAEFTALPQVVLVVTRTPNSGVGAGVAVALPDAVDASNNTWSGVAVPAWDTDEASTPKVTTIKIVDNNTLDVECTYSLHFRASSNVIVTAYINRAVGSAGALIYETGVSLGHAHEIYT